MYDGYSSKGIEELGLHLLLEASDISNVIILLIFEIIGGDIPNSTRKIGR